MFINACSNEELLPKTELEKNGTISLTASMPEEQATRVALNQESNKFISLTWEEDDQLDLAFVQDELKIKSKATVRSISEDGKKAEFDIIIPDKISTSRPFTLYGVYGGGSTGGLSDMNPTDIVLPSNPGNATTLKSLESRNDVMLYFEGAKIDLKNPEISVTFQHLGAIFNITLINRGSTIFKNIAHAHLVGVDNDGKWAYNSGVGAKIYDLESREFKDTSSADNYISFKAAKSSLSVADTITFWGWYPPLPDTKWPELKLQLKNGSNVTLATTKNSKLARKTETSTGRVYYFYSIWDGTELEFTDETFITEEEYTSKFAIFDALAYPGKPSLEPEGLLPLNLIYEVHLTKPTSVGSNSVILDIGKINTMAELASEFPDVMVSTDVEDWWGLDQHEMHNRFSTIFNKFREKNSSVTIGNYAIATSALCVRRFYNPGKTDNAILTEWRNYNAARWKTLEIADAAMPVAYIAEPNIDSWVRDLQITANEIRKHSDKKIYVYIWPQYYDKPDSPYYRKFVSPEIWRQMLEATYQYCDGVILWSSTRDENDEPARWNRPELQAMWQTTKDFINTHSANIRKPKSEPERIFLDNPTKKFKIFSSLSYAGTPDFTSRGLHKLRIATEQELSNGTINNIYEPVPSKIEALAQEVASEPDVPVFITGGTWIRDRTSNPQAMIDRHKKVKDIFKNKNPHNRLSKFNVGPSSLSGLRVTGSNFYTNLSSWKTTANILNPLNNHVDILVPASYIVDDNIALWKREFYLTIKHAKENNHGKPIYAHLHTDYFNQKENFSNSYKPISESTFTEMLEAVYKICDGVILTSLSKDAWSEQYGFWKALQKFVDKHKANIEIPTKNLIVNGSFENTLPFFGKETTYNNDEYISFVNCQGFFDKLSQTQSPSLDAPAPVRSYEWFERGTSQHHCRTQIDHLNARTGTKSAFLWSILGKSDENTGPNGWYSHNLTQRLSLDDNKKYEFSFYAKKEEFTHPNFTTNPDFKNHVDEIVVGIISSADALPTTNYTHFERIPITTNNNWEKISVSFDLPAIIAQNPGKSFDTCAVLIAIGTKWGVNKTVMAKVNIDDVRLIETK